MNTGPASVRSSICLVFAGLLLSGCTSYGASSSSATLSGQKEVSSKMQLAEAKLKKSAKTSRAVKASKTAETQQRRSLSFMERMGFVQLKKDDEAKAKSATAKKSTKTSKKSSTTSSKSAKTNVRRSRTLAEYFGFRPRQAAVTKDDAAKTAKNTSKKTKTAEKKTKASTASKKAKDKNVTRRQPRTLAEFFGFRPRQAVSSKADADKKVKTAEKEVRKSVKNTKASTASKEVQQASAVRRAPARSLSELLGLRPRQAASAKSDAKKDAKVDKTTTSTVAKENAKKAADKQEKVQLARLPSTVDTSGNVTRSGEIYLFRGLANVFSRGMDQMAIKLANRGLDARVFNHASWGRIANNIVARHKAGEVSYPIIIMGHSLGANASTQMAKYLGDSGVPVSYVVSFDPTITTYVGKNVKQVTNYYLPNDRRDNIVVKSNGFRGRLRNVDMTAKGVNHFVIEKNPKLQIDSIDRIMAITKPLPQSKRKG